MNMIPMKMQQNKQSAVPLIPGSSMPQGASPWNNAMYASRNFFVYESDTLVALNAGASANLTFNIAGDSDFFWTKFASFALVGGTATLRNADQLPAVTVLIINTTTGRQYSSSAVPLPSISGQGILPFILPQITMWQRKSTIQIQLQNVGSANYSNLYLSFQGIKAFPNPGM
jgi:hypothetical protein